MVLRIFLWSNDGDHVPHSCKQLTHRGSRLIGKQDQWNLLLCVGMPTTRSVSTEITRACVELVDTQICKGFASELLFVSCDDLSQ